MQPKTYFSNNQRVAWKPVLLAFLTAFLPCFGFSNNHLVMVDAGPDRNICEGESAQLMASGANSYTWSPATGLSCTNCPDPVAAPAVTTAYEVMGDDGTVDSLTVFVFTEPTILSVTDNDPTDCNLPNGSIVVQVDGNGLLEYSIDGGNIWSASNTFTALASGMYSIAVRYAGGACLTIGPNVTLQAPDAPEILTIAPANPTLCDNPNGAIIISATDGISPLQYSIDGGVTWQGSNTFQLLGAGKYQPRVRNSDGSCEIQAPPVTLTGSPDEPNITDVLEFGPSNCNADDGLITILVSNDNGNFEYSIDGGASFQPSNSFPNLTEGIYEIVARRNDGTCSAKGGFVELLSTNHPTYFGVSVVAPSSCGANDGNITILAFGQSTLEFSINGGATWQLSNVFPNLFAGFYQVAVRNTDGSCFTTGEDVILEQPPAPEIMDVLSTDPTGCGTNDGSIIVAATGAGPLEYSINGGGTWTTDFTFSNLGDGVYTIAVRQIGTNCAAVYSGNPIELSGPGNPPVIDNVNVTGLSDCGISDGSIFIEATGNGQLEYSIDNGATWSNSAFFGNLGDGFYNIKVREVGASCEAEFNGNPVEVEGSSNVPVILGVNATDPSDCGAMDGTISIQAFGVNLEYSINGGSSYQAGALFENLGAGDYVVVVREAGTNCEVFYNANPVELISDGMIPFISSVMAIPPSDCGQADGTILISASGGGALEFSVDDGLTWSASPVFPSLGQGTYNVRVREQGTNCEAAYSDNPILLESGGIVPTISSVDASDPSTCGATDGAISINASGTGNMEFSIDNGATWQASPDFTGLVAGIYNITVREGDCQTFYQNNPVELKSPGNPPVIQNVNVTDVTACGASDGTIFINVISGGTFEYSIDNGANWVNTPGFFNLPIGDYLIIVRETGSGCETVWQDNPVEIQGLGNAPVISGVDIVHPSTCGVNDGSLVINATGSGQLGYSIDGGQTFVASNAFNGLGAGGYIIVVSQSGNPQCNAEETVFLNDVQTCLDTVQFTVPAGVASTVCLDASVFDFPGLFTSTGFCDQGNAGTVLATSISGECIDVQPAQGFIGVSPDLICTVHCFNNNPDQCDTTYIQIIVSPDCDDVFPIAQVDVPYVGSSTEYCVPIPLSSIPNYDLFLQGLPLQNTDLCDLDQTVAYSYGFLPDGGLGGPYAMTAWEVNGTSLTGSFDDPQGMADLMNSLDPSGFWQINAQGSIIFGGDPNSQYGNMEIRQISTNIPTVLMTNFTFQPQGFSIALPTPEEYVLVALDPDTGCSDTLVINAQFDVPEKDTIFINTTVNTPSSTLCLNGAELPTNAIVNVGFCGGPFNGTNPLVTDSCVFYVPNLNFAGQDEFCMVVCDGGFPQVCDTTIFLVNVSPEQDTVFLNIPAGATSVDSCFGSFVIELPGAVEQASFCSINANELDGSVNGNCVSFTALNNFVGTSEVCVAFCSNGVCDTTIVFVVVNQPVDCDEIFDQDIAVVPSVTGQGFFCVPIPPGEVVNYTTTVDGNPFDAFGACNFGNVLFYNYSSLPPGALQLDAWSVNGNVFSGNFSNIQDLVDQMNVWDQTGGWENNLLGLTIFGGDPANTYSNLVITDNQSGQFEIIPDVVVLPHGSTLELNGPGGHQVIMTDQNGCADTITIVVELYSVDTDTLVFETNINTTVVPICATSLQLLGNVSSFNFCGLPANGSVALVSDTCVSYTPNLNFIGQDEFCLVICDDFTPVVCDTFIVIVNTQLPTDTVLVDAANVTPFDECLDGTVLQLPGNIDTAFACGFDPSEVSVSFAGNCVNIDLEDSFVGTTEVCVIHCTNAPFTICDTTYLIISFDGNLPCGDLFDPDQVNAALVNNEGEICLPLDPLNLSEYDILLDGSPYNNPLVGCDVDSVYTYFYAQVFGQGNAGPYSIEWTLNGNVQTGTVDDMVALVNLMNGLDPAGGWVLDPLQLTISSSNDAGNYGLLQISHPSGSVAGLTPNFNGFPTGTLITFTGPGGHELVLVNTLTQCDDTLFINAVGDVDTIQIVTVQDIPSAQECIDTTGLPGNFVGMTVCGMPANGSLLIDGECFIFIPAAGFVGNNEACLQICDDMGNCEIIIVLITVESPCAQFILFPDVVVQLAAADCDDLLTYCIPIETDLLGNFLITDNGTPVTDIEPCNGNFSQVSIDTGFHEIIVQHLATQCVDTLLVNVDCTPDNDCGATALTPLVLDADDCNGTVEFCVSVPFSDLGSKEILDNGVPATGVAPCSANSQFVGITLDTGIHQLIISDTVKMCSDTFLVTVNCLEVVDSTIDLTILENDSTEICLSDYDFPTTAIDSLVNICESLSDGNATFVIDTTTWCITIYGEIIGMDTFCFKAYFGDTCAVLTANVDVTDPCPDYFPNDQLVTTVSCNVDSALVCIPIEPTILQSLEIMVNGTLLTDDLLPCETENFLFFPYDSLPSGGLLGPFVIKEWTINGNTFTDGQFDTPAEMAAIMTLWDNTGDWSVGVAANGDIIIIGGNTNTDYGTLEIEQILFSNVVFMEIRMGQNVLQYGISLPTMASMVTFTDPSSGCSETIVVDVVCVQSDTITDVIELGASDTFCLDLSELLGDVVSVENICENPNSPNVSFEIIGECIVYTGLDLGIETACIVVCDDLGICDTTYLIITSQLTTNDTVLVAVDDEVVTGAGQPILIDVLQNDQSATLSDFYIVDDPMHGTASFLPNGMINYTPDDGYCDDIVPDTFSYAICNMIGCDTATVLVFVFCDDLHIFNAFSPNGDDKNEFFVIRGLQNYPDHRLYVYNRWGNLVLQAADYQNTWNGTWNDKILPDGTYFYVLDLGNGEDPLKGYVQIRR